MKARVCILLIIFTTMVTLLGFSNANSSIQKDVYSSSDSNIYADAETQLVIRLLTNPDPERRYIGMKLAEVLDVPREILRPFLLAITTNISYWIYSIYAILTMADLGILEENDIYLLNVVNVPYYRADMVEATRAYGKFKLGIEPETQLQILGNIIDNPRPLDGEFADSTQFVLDLIAKLGASAQALVPYVERLLDDPYIALEAHSTLFRMGIDQEHHLSFILEAALDSDSSAEQGYAMYVLVLCGPEPEVITAFETLMLNLDASTAEIPIELLAELGPSALPLAPSIIEVVRSRIWGYAYYTNALLAMGDEIVPYMKELLDDPDPGVRLTANYILYEYNYNTQSRLTAIAELLALDNDDVLYSNDNVLPTRDIIGYIGSPIVPALIAELQDCAYPNTIDPLSHLNLLSNTIPDDMLGFIYTVALDESKHYLERKYAIEIIGDHLSNEASIQVLIQALHAWDVDIQLEVLDCLLEAVRQGEANIYNLPSSILWEIKEDENGWWQRDGEIGGIEEIFRSRLQQLIDELWESSEY